MDIVEEVERGVSDYYRGVVPGGWDSAVRRAASPYLSAWYWESMLDNGLDLT